MSQWETVALRDVAVVYDGPHATPAKTDEGAWYLSISSLNNGRFDFVRSAHLSEVDLPRWTKRVAPQSGDTLFSYETRLGEAAYWEHDVEAALGRRMGLLRPKAGKVEPRYLSYAYLGPQFQEVVRQKTLHGATVDRIPVGDMPSWPLLLPPLAVQRAILRILGSIDRLIENNRRRMEVLEEMARAIYREWFVRFRFRGHENVELIDSTLGPIPDGWEVKTVGDVVELKYGKALKADARSGGGVAVVGSSGIVGWHDQELVPGPAIVVGRKGNVGSVVWIDGPCWPIDTTYFVVTDLPLRFVAEQLRRTEFLNTHAAVPGLGREQAYSKPFLRPPQDVLDAFEVVADSLASEASSLMSQNDRLASMRDLLLPKLVTGQIDVSALDLDALVEDAVA
jgi:type I restriction enzyme, S subunit